ncbi:MAG: peptidoglycan-binding domain-containing protein [Rhodospirillaceae bacterium]
MLRASVVAISLIAATALAGPAMAQQGFDQPRMGAQQSTQYTVADLQRALANAGYNPGPIDGSMGPSTRRAVSAFQQDVGLRVTGEPDSQVVAILERRGLLTAQASPQPWERAGRAEPGWMPPGQQQQTQQGWEQPVPMPVPQGQVQSQSQYPTSEADPALVADVQAALRAQGYPIAEASGELDPDTRAAIRTFQRRQGLPATGQPSAELLALIETGARGPGQMSDAEVIREIEVRLHNRGYTIESIDGRVDQATSQAISQYQQERGLQATGQASRDLLADLQQADMAPSQAEAPAPQQGDIFRQLGERALEQLEGR